MKQSRKEFLQFLGMGSLTLSTTSLWAMSKKPAGIVGLSPGMASDNVVLVPGLSYEKLISWGDSISEDGKLRFGFNNDYTALLENSSTPSQAYLWVNHEYPDPVFLETKKPNKTKADIEKEMKNVGGSFLELRRASGKWSVVTDSSKNFRLDGQSKIPFSNGESIQGSSVAIGTFANCAGGKTPWGSVLTCEENYQDYYGDVDDQGQIIEKGYLGWSTYQQRPPQHYGWVVEIFLEKKQAVKHVGLGRFSHECATVTRAKDGRVVVYSGDDKAGECLYKFVSDSTDSLHKGTLYVANLEQGKWIEISYKKSKAFQKMFATEQDMFCYTRKVAHILGGTPLDRPEDIEIIPGTANVLVALTNNTGKKNYFGSLLKIIESNQDAASETFQSETFLTGGETTGFACPDNLAFDPRGNLWFTTDISGNKMNKDPYTPFGNNGLFVVLAQGPQKGQAIQMASAPFDAEFTGPTFSEDGKTLFLSVQHPGEETKTVSKLTSHWPDGGSSIPKPSVIVIQGPALEAISAKK
ncbi:MAG: DUF839 domain-containing protein [Bdellovibrionota bacterium]